MKINDNRIPYQRAGAASPLSVADTVSVTGGSGASSRTAGPSIAAAALPSSSLSNALWNLQSQSAALIDEFSQWADMTPAERIRAQYLEEHGFSEAALQAMAPDKRAALEAEIRDAVKEQLGSSTETDPSDRFRG